VGTRTKNPLSTSIIFFTHTHEKIPSQRTMHAAKPCHFLHFLDILFIIL